MGRSAKAVATSGAARSFAQEEGPAEVLPAPRPLLKWVGGKTQLLQQMQPFLPKTFRRYFEPFVGGAALFFDLRARRPDMPAFLSDVNAELVNCYVAVRDDVEAVIRALRRHRYESAYYYEIRAQNPAALASAERAARTIFLNKTGYNGLYRVNRSGQFNVPFGRFTNPVFCDVDNLHACARALRDVSIEHADFSSVLEVAQKGDFVYFDPPYVPLSSTSDFTAYIPSGFGAAEQEELAEVFRALAKRGVHVLLSNSDTPIVRKLYAGFKIERVYASRSVNSVATGRGKLAEVMVRSKRAS